VCGPTQTLDRILALFSLSRWPRLIRPASGYSLPFMTALEVGTFLRHRGKRQRLHGITHSVLPPVRLAWPGERHRPLQTTSTKSTAHERPARRRRGWPDRGLARWRPTFDVDQAKTRRSTRSELLPRVEGGVWILRLNPRLKP